MPFIYFIFSIFIALSLSCSVKTSLPPAEENSLIYKSTGSQNHYMRCQFFADTNFQGYIYNSSQEDCVYLDILKSPKNLFKSDQLFIQIYPFTSGDNELIFDSSVPIYTFEKNNLEEPLMKSFIIDDHIIKVDLQLNEDHFFKDHQFEICDLDENWEGLQLVIYKRVTDQEDSIPFRTSKILIPPFLVHPEYFRETKGELLTAYHPFFQFIPQSNPQAYYDLAEQMCSGF